MKKLIEPYKSPIEQPFIYLLVIFLLSSCVEYIHPEGQWAEPVDLNLHEDSLKGVVIKLSCVKSKITGLIDDQNEDSSQRRPCPYLASIFEETGAIIYQTSNERNGTEDDADPNEKSKEIPSNETNSKPYDIIVQYKEVNSSSSDCVLGFIPFYFSISLWPCRSDTQSRASIVVSNPSHGFAQEWPLVIDTHTYFGIGALALKFVDYFKDPTPSEYEKQLKENFVKFVRNKTYSVYQLTAKKRKS